MRNPFIFSLFFIALYNVAYAKNPPVDLKAYHVQFVAHFDGRHIKFCSGALMSKSTVLTAAHCQGNIEHLMSRYPDATVTVESELSGEKSFISGVQLHPKNDAAIVAVDGTFVAGQSIAIASPQEISFAIQNPKELNFAVYKNQTMRVFVNTFSAPLESWTYRVNEFAEPDLKKLRFSEYLFLPNIFNDVAFLEKGDSGLPLFVFINGQWKTMALLVGGALVTSTDALKAKFLNRPPRKKLLSQFEKIDLNF